MVEPERTQAIWDTRVACWLSKTTCCQAHACIPAPTLTPTPTTPPHPPQTHIHTHKYVIVIAFLLQKLFCKRASVLRYTCIKIWVLFYLVIFDFSILWCSKDLKFSQATDWSCYLLQRRLTSGILVSDKYKRMCNREHKLHGQTEGLVEVLWSNVWYST